MLTGPVKSGAFAAAEALVLPSHQENFGMVVAEALSFGLPVLISTQVNISDVVASYNAGFVEPDTLSGTCSLIERWLSADHCSMGLAAERCYRDRFEIDRTARELLKVWSGGVMERWSDGVME
jgi:glycosyltransferase involved in cell wall biosynthesis